MKDSLNSTQVFTVLALHLQLKLDLCWFSIDLRELFSFLYSWEGYYFGDDELLAIIVQFFLLREGFGEVIIPVDSYKSGRFARNEEWHAYHDIMESFFLFYLSSFQPIHHISKLIKVIDLW